MWLPDLRILGLAAQRQGMGGRAGLFNTGLDRSLTIQGVGAKMTERIDNFSRSLASGVSRRKAFWQILTGVGGLGLLATQKAAANDVSCPTACFQQASIAYSECITDGLEDNPGASYFEVVLICLGQEGILYDECLARSVKCGKGKCAQITWSFDEEDGVTVPDIIIDPITTCA